VDSRKQRSRAGCAASLPDHWNAARLAVSATRGRCVGGTGTTPATAAATTLSSGTYPASRGCRTIRRCAYSCLYLFATLVITFEFIAIVVEVITAFKNNSGFMLGLLDGRGTLGALGTGTTVTITITAATFRTFATVRTLTALRTLAACWLGSRW